MWWILSYIEMKQPWVYMYSPSQSPLPPPSPPAPSRFSQCTRSKRLSHASNLASAHFQLRLFSQSFLLRQDQIKRGKKCARPGWEIIHPQVGESNLQCLLLCKSQGSSVAIRIKKRHMRISALARRYWRTRKSGVLQSRGSQRVECDLVTKQHFQYANIFTCFP